MSTLTPVRFFLSKKFSWFLDSCLLALGIGTFFLIFLGNHPLGVPDEARYAEIPREMIALKDYLTPHLNYVLYFEKPPLFYWLQVGAIKLFGLSEWAVRLPNALMALFGCLCVYSGGRLLYDRRTGWFASLILATSLFYFAMAHIVTLDMTFTNLMSASLLSFLIGAILVSPQRRYFFYSAYIFSALAVLTKGLIGLLFPIAIVGFWMLFINEWRLLQKSYLFSGIILFLLIAIPWHLWVALKNPGFLQFYFIDQHFLRYFTTDAGRYKPDWFFIPVLLLGLLPWTFFLPQAIANNLPRAWSTRHSHKIALFLMIWGALIFIFFSFSHSKLVTYILPIFPPLAILIGRYFSMHWQTISKNSSVKSGYSITALVVALLTAILFLIAQQKNALFNLHAALNYVGYTTVIWTIGACFSAWLSNIKKSMAAFFVLLISTIIAFIFLVSSLQVIDLGSIKPLIKTLNPLLKPNDPVISYGRYYQDLPYYLQRRIIVVNWRGELDFGMQHQNTRDWMIDDKKFLQIWHNPQQAFLVTDFDTYQTLNANNPGQFHWVDQSNRNVLLTNLP